jgi:hypothetical protein
MRVRRALPEPGSMRTMAVSTSFHLIRLPTVDLPVRFETRLAP